MKTTEQAQTGFFDVIILGSGLGGTILGTILARHGLEVLIVEAGVHPRYAVGESTAPDYARTLAFLADRFDVPELHNLATFEHNIARVSRACGINRGMGFIHHRGPRFPSAEDTHQLTPIATAGHGTHLFRQDTDQYMISIAVEYGCIAVQRAIVTDVKIDGDGVVLVNKFGGTFRGRMLIDACGARSPAVRQMGLREEPCSLRTRSRSIYNHMVSVAPYDDCVPSFGNASPWHEGTLHHVFDGGWMWVIPFNNFEDAPNPLISVGLTLDVDAHPPRMDVGPEEEFFSFVHRFPDVARQFAEARAVRPWMSSPRLQYTSTSYVSERYVQLAHTGHFVDPLFSRGLSSTLMVVNAVAPRVLDAVRDRELSRERFLPIEALQRALAQRNDELVASSYIAFRDLRLWDAWLRVWAMGQAEGEMHIASAHHELVYGNREAGIAAFDDVPYPGLLFPCLESYKDMFEESVACTAAVGAGETPVEEAVERILDLIRQNELGPPVLGISDTSRRNLVKFDGVSDFLKGVAWLANPTTPQDLRAFHLRGMRAAGRQLVAQLRRPTAGDA